MNTQNQLSATTLSSQFARGTNPKISLRGAWICAGSDDPTRHEPVGTAITIDFAAHRLVCSVRPHLEGWQGVPQAGDSLVAHGLEIHWMPLDSDLDTVPLRAAHIDGIAQTWKQHGFAADAIEVGSVQSLQWQLELTPEGLLLRPEQLHITDLSYFERMCQIHDIDVGTSSSTSLLAHFDRHIRIRRTYGADWLTFESMTYFKPTKSYLGEQLNPPYCHAYPKSTDQAWGWLMPNARIPAEHAFTANGFQLGNIEAYALNVNAWSEGEKQTTNANHVISQRLRSGARLRLASDAQWQKQVAYWGNPLEDLAAYAPEQHRGYWEELLAFAKRTSNQ
jgi:hypothetical protein